LHLPAGTDEGFPRLRIELAGEKDFHLTGEMFTARGPRRGLSVNSSAAAKEAGGNDAGVIENDQFIATEQIGEIYKKMIIQVAFGAREDEEAGRVAMFERPLGNLAGGEVVIEVVKTHRQEV